MVGQELFVDHVQRQIDRRPAPFQVERRVQPGGHQHADLVLDHVRGRLRVRRPEQQQQQPRGHRPPRRQHHSTAIACGGSDSDSGSSSGKRSLLAATEADTAAAAVVAAATARRGRREDRTGTRHRASVRRPRGARSRPPVLAHDRPPPPPQHLLNFPRARSFFAPLRPPGACCHCRRRRRSRSRRAVNKCSFLRAPACECTRPPPIHTSTLGVGKDRRK